MHRAALNYPVQNVNCAAVEKHLSGRDRHINTLKSTVREIAEAGTKELGEGVNQGEGKGNHI